MILARYPLIRKRILRVLIYMARGHRSNHLSLFIGVRQQRSILNAYAKGAFASQQSSSLVLQLDARSKDVNRSLSPHYGTDNI